MAHTLISTAKLVALTQVAYAHHQHYIEAGLPSSAEPVMGVITMPDRVEPSACEVERVARAICKADLVLPDEFSISGKPRWTQYTKQARAAINAMGST